MRIFKNIFFGLIIVLIIAVISGFIYINSLKPQYSGTLEIKNLQSQVSTYFDDYGIPHIYAENQEDAYTALGYLHAQDRLWQMELMRRIAPGRLSEILGKDQLEIDKFFATMGIEEATNKAIKDLDKNSNAYKFAMAYIDGINQFIDEGATPIEFTLVGIKKEHYQLKDMYNVFGYMAFSFAMAQKTDPLLTAIQEKLGTAYLIDLDIVPNTNGTLINTNTPKLEVLHNLSNQITQVTSKLPIPAFIGSNSWVVNANKTNTGSVLFANDPHIEYAQPAVWYEAHIVTPNYEMYGYHLAGLAFPILGHNRDYAYGMTMFENDDIDFYQETNNPSNNDEYKTPTGYVAYQKRTKIIKVKDEDDVILDIKSSRHGPIMNNVQDEISHNTPIAMSWIYTQHKIDILEASYKLSHSKSIEDVRKATSMIHAPGLNIMYGDAKGNVAWWASGQLYTHKKHVNPKFVLDGASGEDDPVEYLNFSKNPMAENPDWNYVYSANNQPDSIAGILYPGYYLPEDRAKRIVELLEPKNDWNKESFSKMIIDATSPIAPNIVLKSIGFINTDVLSSKQSKALEILNSWKGENNKDGIAPTIYQRFIYRYLENTFKDELGDELFGQLLNTHLIKRSIVNQIGNKASIWWDDVATTDVKEAKAEILTKSFKEAIDALEMQLGPQISGWKWGTVHTLEHNHALSVVKALKPYLNVGPFEVGGTEEVIDNKAFDFNDTGLYQAKVGPSTRRIVDFSDVENSISILPTGQSGNPFSEHYDDQADMYNKGGFRKMKMNKEEIIATSRLLIIKPKN